jgi:tetratricopeptide (TPR) repeat protein
LLLLAACAAAAHAIEQGRLLGTVVDAAGAPLSGVKVVITSPEMSTFKLEKTTDARGQFSAIILDAPRAYRIRFEKQGYATLEQPLKLKIEDTLKETYTLAPAAAAPGAAATAGTGGAAAGAGAAPAAAPPAAPAPPANAAEAKAKHDAAVAYNEGVAALKAKDLAGAAAKFESSAALDPKLLAPQAVLATVYLELHRPADALAAADRALALDPGSARHRVLLDRYEALRQLGDRQRAAQAFADLAASHPPPELTRELAVRLYNEAADALRDKKTDDALADLKQALEVDRTLEPAYGALVNLYLGKQDPRAALAVTDRWVAAAPQSLQALQARYKVLTDLKDPRAKEAKAAMDSAKGDAGNPLNQGIELYNANRIPEATQAFERVVQADPNSAKGHFMLGLCYTNAGEMARAKQHFEAFLKVAPPNDPDAETARQMLKELK